MSDDKPDYAAILKNRKPLPTIDIDDLKRRSAEATKANAPHSDPVPLRFSVPPEMLRELRIQAALEDKSVPDLMRAIIAAYLRKQERQGST